MIERFARRLSWPGEGSPPPRERPTHGPPHALPMSSESPTALSPRNLSFVPTVPSNEGIEPGHPPPVAEPNSALIVPPLRVRHILKHKIPVHLFGSRSQGHYKLCFTHRGGVGSHVIESSTIFPHVPSPLPSVSIHSVSPAFKYINNY